MKSPPLAQPYYHPASTARQRLIADVFCVLLATLQTIAPSASLAENKTAANALMEYQWNAYDGALLRQEIAARNPRSPIFRLQKAAQRQAAALAHLNQFLPGNKGWRARTTRWYFGTLFMLYAMRELSLYERSFTRLISNFVTSYADFFSYIFQ